MDVKSKNNIAGKTAAFAQSENSFKVKAHEPDDEIEELFNVYEEHSKNVVTKLLLTCFSFL